MWQKKDEGWKSITQPVTKRIFKNPSDLITRWSTAWVMSSTIIDISNTKRIRQKQIYASNFVWQKESKNIHLINEKEKTQSWSNFNCLWPNESQNRRKIKQWKIYHQSLAKWILKGYIDKSKRQTQTWITSPFSIIESQTIIFRSMTGGRWNPESCLQLSLNNK